MGKTKVLKLTEEDKKILKQIVTSENKVIAQRAMIILKAEGEKTIAEIGQEVGMSAWGVGIWKNRWLEYNFVGENRELEIRKFLESSKGGRPKKCKKPEQVNKIIEISEWNEGRSRSKYQHNKQVAQEARVRGLPQLSPRSIGRILEKHKEEAISNI